MDENKAQTLPETLAEIMAGKAKGTNYDKHLRNFVDGEELIVTITLDEYRDLVSSGARYMEKCDTLTKENGKQAEQINYLTKQLIEAREDAEQVRRELRNALGKAE